MSDKARAGVGSAMKLQRAMVILLREQPRQPKGHFNRHASAREVIDDSASETRGHRRAIRP
jgi:hypothetical protein